MCAAVTIAEVEHLEPWLAPDDVHTPGIFVRTVVATTASTRPIEIVTIREPADAVEP